MATRSQGPGDVQRSQTDQAVHAASGYLQGLADHPPEHHPGMSTAEYDVSHNPGLSTDGGGHESSHSAGLSHDPNYDSSQNPALSHDPSVGDSHNASADPGHDQGAMAANAGVHDAGSAGYHHQ